MSCARVLEAQTAKHVFQRVTGRLWAVGMVLLSMTGIAPGAAPSLDVRNSDCLKPWPANPYYWQYKRAPVVLLGGSVEDNLFQIPDLTAHLDLLKAAGGNYIRNTLSSRDDGNVWMFLRQGDGRYDLDQPDPEYYARLQRLLDLCLERDIIVQFELWDRFDYAMQYWQQNPFRPANNVRYTPEDSRLENDYPDHPGSNRNPFFRTPPDQEDNALVLRYQQAHIDRVLAVSLPYPNVLYCMDNETGADPRWGAYWSGYLKKKAAEAGVIIQTTEMWDDWNLQAEQHRATLDHPEIYSFVDTSQNNHKKGQEHWDNFQWVRDYLRASPRPINHVKCYGADGGRYGDSRDGTERFWRSLVGGAASIRFHRPDSGLGLSDRAQAHLLSARSFAEAFSLPRAMPLPATSVLADVEPNEAHVSVIHAEAMAVYMPRGGAVTLKLPEGTGACTLRWLDIEGSTWTEAAPRDVSTDTALQAPGEGPWLAVLEVVR
jgi:hypothetical protein